MLKIDLTVAITSSPCTSSNTSSGIRRLSGLPNGLIIGHITALVCCPGSNDDQGSGSDTEGKQFMDMSGLMCFRVRAGDDRAPCDELLD